MAKYTEREIYRNMRIIEKDIKRAEKNKQEYINKRKELEEYINNIGKTILHIDQYINDQKQKLIHWATEERKLKSNKI